MRKTSFFKTVRDIRARKKWYDVFPPDVEILRADPGKPGYFLLRAVDVAELLNKPAIEVSGFWRHVRKFQIDLQKIAHGLGLRGKYLSTKSGLSPAAQRDYEKAMRKFFRAVQKAAPATDFELLKARLKYAADPFGGPRGIGIRRLHISNEKERKLILRFVGELLGWALEAQCQGRPPDDTNILIFHLVNSLTVWKRKKDKYGLPSIPLFDKHGFHKLERQWDDMARCLIWIHYHIFRIPWLASFIKSHASSDSGRSMIKLKKIIQRRHDHLWPPKDRRRGDPEAAVYYVGIKRIVAEGNRFRAWRL
jgi:hypothetical protein